MKPIRKEKSAEWESKFHESLMEKFAWFLFLFRNQKEGKMAEEKLLKDLQAKKRKKLKSFF